MQCLKKQDERLPHDFLDNFDITFRNATGKWNDLIRRNNNNFALFSTKIVKIQIS